MKKCLVLLCLCGLLLAPSLSQAFSLSGAITGGQGLPLRYVFAVPMTLDTFFVTIAIPFINTYSFANLDSGGYILFAYQDLNTNVLPDLDEPRGFYGGDAPAIFNLISDTSGVNIEIHPPNSGGFTGTISYSGSLTGPTYVLAYYDPAFADTLHGIGILLFNNTGNGDYSCIVDSFTTYYAYAFMDVNSNFSRDADEPYGVYGGGTPAPIQVQPTNFPDNVDIVMQDPAWTPEPRPAVPVTCDLTSVYPNPFNSAVTIAFTTSTTPSAELAVYNPLGQRVVTLARGPFAPGRHEVRWNADGLPSGLYFVRLSTAATVASRPLLLLK